MGMIFLRANLSFVFLVLFSPAALHAQLATGTVDFTVEDLRDKEQVTISLSDNSTLVLLRDYVVDDAPGKYTWIGFVQDDVNGRAFITVNAPNAVGTIHTSTKSYKLTITEAATDPVEELDPTVFPAEAEPLLPPIFSHGFEDDVQALAVESPAAACDDTPAGIDVLVLYSDDAAAAPTDIQAEIWQAVIMANQNFLDSHIKPGEPGGIELGLNLVHTQMLQVNENTPLTSEQLLDDLTAGKYEFSAVPELRDQYAADLVILILESADNCGQAHLSYWDGKGNESRGFGYVDRNCIHQYTFSHEVGHLFGAHHDKYVFLNNDDPLPDPSRPIYGYTYLGPGIPWRTVMAYEIECLAAGFDYCPRLGFFSSPHFFHAGTPTGVAGTDNRQQLIDAAPFLACYRARPKISVQKLNKATGQATQEGLVESSGNIITPAINCGLACQGSAIAGTTAFLTASDVGDWRFVRWALGGVCPGSTNPICEVTVIGDQTARAEFATDVTLTVQKLDRGTGQATQEGLVQSSGDDVTPTIDCGQVCEGAAISGSTVQLTASNTGNWRFVRWAPGGVCAGSTNPQCGFVVDSDKTAKAEFVEDEFGFEVAESEAPWSPENPRLNCFHYEGEYLVTGYVASFDRCYSGMSAVIRCVGSSCDSSRFKVAISKSILSFTDGTCNSYQDPFGADPGSAQTYVPGSGWWFGLGEGWTKAWPSNSEISPLANGNSIFQNFHWIGDDPGAACVGDQTRTLELEFNVYDVTTGTYTKIPFVMHVP